MKQIYAVWHRTDRDRFFFDKTLSASSVAESHTFVGNILAEDMEDVFEITNCNAPVEFANFCRAHRIHTSTSVGDVIVDASGNIFQVACCGFEPVEK